jgi:hypothetical protein
MLFILLSIQMSKQDNNLELAMLLASSLKNRINDNNIEITLNSFGIFIEIDNQFFAFDKNAFGTAQQITF